MGTTQTFVLRLLTDTDDPQALRGMLHVVASGEEAPFADGPALLALLRRMISIGCKPEEGCVESVERGGSR